MAARAGQDAKTVRRDVSDKDMGAILVAVVIGVQTMIDLGTHVDVGKIAAAITSLLRPASSPPRRPAARKRASRP